MSGPNRQLDIELEPLRDRVNAELARVVRQSADCPTRLQEAMDYSLLAGGKRLRPLLVLMACDACGGAIEAALPAACAVEMVHTYSLIHDDLPAMDDDDLRRGRPTNHKVFGEAMAILAGDALLTLAFEVIAANVRPGDVAAACCADLASAAGAVGMVGGQVADLEAEQASATGEGSSRPISPSPHRPIDSNGSNPATPQGVAHLEAIHLRKTGRLLRSSLTMGARIAQAPATLRNALDTYGKCVGLAFQIADDLLDVCGDQAKMGKGVRKDASLGKLTYPALLGVEASREKARGLVTDACRSIAPLGERGRRLEALAHFVLERDH